MTAILLSALFLSSGLFAAAAMAATWQRYGRAALAVRGEFEHCSEWREVRARISEVTVSRQATVLRPAFTRPEAGSSERRALPAAA